MSFALRLRSRPRTSQPPEGTPIDWANPLCKGLSVVVCNLIEIVTGSKLSSTGVTTQICKHGITNTIASAVASNKIIIPKEISGAVSVVALTSRDASATTSGPGAVAEVVTNRTAGQATFWELNLGNGFGELVDIDKPRFSNQTGGFGKIYLNGNLLSGNNPASTALVNNTFYVVAATASTGANSSSSGQMYIGNVNNSFSFVGRFPLVLLWNRELSSAEVAAISANPWQVFAP